MTHHIVRGGAPTAQASPGSHPTYVVMHSDRCNYTIGFRTFRPHRQERTPSPLIPYMEAKGGAFYSDRERNLTTHHRHSRNNQSHANSALGFRTFRPHRQEKDPTL